MLTVILFSTLASFAADTASDRDRFHRAYFREVAEGRVEEALREYRALESAFGYDEDRSYRAWVQVRIAACELALGNREAVELALEHATAIPKLDERITKAINTVRQRLRGDVAVDPAPLPNRSETQKAILLGAKWLVAHQRSDGAWSPEDRGAGIGNFDVGVTGLALRALHDSELAGDVEGREQAIDRAIHWLLAHQSHGDEPRTRGAVGQSDNPDWIWSHAWATLALIEIYQDSLEESLREPITEAVSYGIRHQNEGYGWGTEYQCGRNDTLNTGWMVASLEIARELARDGRLDIPVDAIDTSIASAHNWTRRCTASSNGRTGMVAPGDPGPGLAYHQAKENVFAPRETMTAMGLAIRLAAGESKDEASFRKSVALLLDELPSYGRDDRGSTVDFVYWERGTDALRRVGGSPWGAWQGSVTRAILPTQEQDGDARGSWAPLGFWGPVGGRTLPTALAVSTLVEASRPERN
ncbi:MAG: hypothetical protein KDC38_00205 [Planctomycetes bacterium]|nr:hypothetical protein [Planctomycetota bacterium]